MTVGDLILLIAEHLVSTSNGPHIPPHILEQAGIELTDHIIDLDAIDRRSLQDVTALQARIAELEEQIAAASTPATSPRRRSASQRTTPTDPDATPPQDDTANG